jgi:predicted RNA-binding protein with PIN domain
VKVIFVDGYNVINSWPELKELKDFSYEAARKKLINDLQNYAAYKGYKIILTFDAHKVPGSMEKKEKIDKNITVVFTQELETADSFIERNVNDIGRKIDVCVVTSDLLEQQLVFQRGATRMSSIEFYNEVNNSKINIKNKINNNYSEKKSSLEERVKKDIFEKLDRMRKSK